MSLLPLLWTTLANYTVAYLEDYHEKGQSNFFWLNFRPVLGKIVSQTFEKKEWFLTYHWVLLPSFKVSIVYIDENCPAKIYYKVWYKEIK